MRCLKGLAWEVSRAAINYDYGCVAYGFAAKTSIKRMETVQAQALTLCCGALKMIPVSTLQVEVGEMPLHIR